MKVHLAILGVCLVCTGRGVWEVFMGHLDHAWYWFLAAVPGGQAIRIQMMATREVA